MGFGLSFSTFAVAVRSIALVDSRLSETDFASCPASIWRNKSLEPSSSAGGNGPAARLGSHLQCLTVPNHKREATRWQVQGSLKN